MNNLTFSQKNDLVVKHKSKKHFGKDSELFQKHFPTNKLMNYLARANEFSFEQLDGQMLYLLLDKVSMEEILKNREGKQEAPVDPNPPADENLKELKKRIELLEESTEVSAEDIDFLRNELNDKDASIEELQSKIEALEKKAVKKRVNRKSSPQ